MGFCQAVPQQLDTRNLSTGQSPIHFKSAFLRNHLYTIKCIHCKFTVQWALPNVHNHITITTTSNYFGLLMWRADWLEKTLMLRNIEGRRRRGWQRNKMVGWYHQLNGHEFEQALDIAEGQWSLECCSPWGHKESDMTERLNRTEPSQNQDREYFNRNL